MTHPAMSIALVCNELIEEGGTGVMWPWLQPSKGADSIGCPILGLLSQTIQINLHGTDGGAFPVINPLIYKFSAKHAN